GTRLQSGARDRVRPALLAPRAMDRTLRGRLRPAARGFPHSNAQPCPAIRHVRCGDAPTWASPRVTTPTWARRRALAPTTRAAGSARGIRIAASPPYRATKATDGPSSLQRFVRFPTNGHLVRIGLWPFLSLSASGRVYS